MWSLSLRERGLKCICRRCCNQRLQSLSLRERGLKYLYTLGEFDDDKVALLARAWIEIAACPHAFAYLSVALLARAWIEMR